MIQSITIYSDLDFLTYWGCRRIYIEPVSYNIQENVFSFIRQWHLAPPVPIKVPDDQRHNTFAITGYLTALLRSVLTFARDRKNIKNSQTYYRKMKHKTVFSIQVIFLKCTFSPQHCYVQDYPVNIPLISIILVQCTFCSSNFPSTSIKFLFLLQFPDQCPATVVQVILFSCSGC